MSLQVAVREELWGGVKLSKPLLKPWDCAVPALSTGFAGTGEVPTACGGCWTQPAGGSRPPGLGCDTNALAAFTPLCWLSSAAWILGCKKRRWNLMWPFLCICRYGSHKRRELDFWKSSLLDNLLYWVHCNDDYYVSLTCEYNLLDIHLH